MTRGVWGAEDVPDFLWPTRVKGTRHTACKQDEESAATPEVYAGLNSVTCQLVEVLSRLFLWDLLR